MPIMDGLTCTRKIRDYEADGTIVKHVPIIAVTANARLEQIDTALAAGMVCSSNFIGPQYLMLSRTTLSRNHSKYHN